MATNRKLPVGRYLQIDVSSFSNDVLSGEPAYQADSVTAPTSGIAGIAQHDKDGNGNTVIDRAGVYNITVQATNDAGTGTAVAYGDNLYVNDGAGSLNERDVTPDNTDAIFLGKALASITSGSSADIDVLIGFEA